MYGSLPGRGSRSGTTSFSKNVLPSLLTPSHWVGSPLASKPSTWTFDEPIPWSSWLAAAKASGSRLVWSVFAKWATSVSRSFSLGARQPPPPRVCDVQYEPTLLGSISADGLWIHERPVQLSSTIPFATV